MYGQPIWLSVTVFVFKPTVSEIHSFIVQQLLMFSLSAELEGSESSHEFSCCHQKAQRFRVVYPWRYIKFSLVVGGIQKVNSTRTVCWAKTTKDDLLDEELIQALFSDSAHLCTAAWVWPEVLPIFTFFIRNGRHLQHIWLNFVSCRWRAAHHWRTQSRNHEWVTDVFVLIPAKVKVFIWNIKINE